MTALGLILIPLVMAGVVFAVPWERVRPWLVALTAAVHTSLAAYAGYLLLEVDEDAVSALEGWLSLDAPGMVVLGLISVLFLLCSVYAPFYLAVRANRTNRVLCPCML